ncbi:MAG TPA: choice-of-anchor D domain-containing protein [Thermoanaerobaculia bacterium]
MRRSACLVVFVVVLLALLAAAQPAVAAPVLSVQQGATAIAKGSTYTFPATTPVGTSISVLFTISNTGNANLTLGNASSLVSGGAFSEIVTPTTPVASGGNTVFRVRLLSGTPGTFSGTVSIASNDPVNPTFTFTVKGTVTGPSISVQQGGTQIANGSTYTFPAATPVGVSTSVLFTISNTGSAPLDLGNAGTLVSGGAFSEIATPATPVAAGGNAVFRVRLLSGTAGTFTGTVSIASDDPVNPTFTFTVKGTVTGPSISMQQGSTQIANGSTYTFPSTPIATPVSVAFTISNTGSAPLDISNAGTLVACAAFSEIATPATPVAAGSNTTFRVRLQSATPGIFTCTVTIASDDPVHPNFTFTIVGTVTAPAISVQQGATQIANGSTFTFPASTPVGVGTSVLFTITNTGSAPLDLGNATTLVSGAAFTEIATPATPVAVGSNTTFRVRLQGGFPGTATGTVTIASDDPVHPTFTFTIVGTVTGPAISVQQGITQIANGSTFAFPASTPVGVATSVLFTITNTGNAALDLSNTATLVSGAAFTELVSPTTPVNANGGTTTFRVRLQGGAAGTARGTVTIASDDPVQPTFTFTIVGTVTAAPAIGVQQGSTAIANGSTFNFPAATFTGVPETVTFTITNSGSAPLNLSNPAALVRGSCFSESQSPATPVTATGATSFAVQALSSASGTCTGTVTIQSDDPINGTLTFTVTATISQAPHLRVVQSWNGTTAVPGDTVTFADEDPGAAESLQLLLVNDGPGSLTVDNPSALVSGPAFTQLTAAPASLAANQSAGVFVRMQGGYAGVQAGSFTVSSTDPRNPTYSVNLAGAIGLTLPPLRVESGDGIFVTHQGTYAFPDTGTGQAASRAFTIFNDGTQDFVIANLAAMVSGDVAFDEQVQPASATVPAGGSQVFRVQLLASTAGAHYGEVTIASADPTQKPFLFGVSGNVQDPDFTLSVTPSSRGVVQGQDVGYTVTLTSSFGFSSDVSLAVSGLDSNSTHTFSQPVIAGGDGTSSMRITTSAATAVGTETLTVIATGGGVTHTATASLIVSPAQQSSLTVTLIPSQQSVQPGGAATFTVAVTGSNLTGNVSLAASVPSGITPAFDSTTVPVGSSANLTLTTAAGIAANSYPFTVTGTISSLSSLANGTLVVQAAQPTGAPTILALSPNVMVAGQVVTVTVSGTNLLNTTIAIPTSQTDPQQPVQRTFPAASIQSVSGDGTSMQVSIDASDPRIIDYYNLQVSNSAGKAVSPFRVLPPGPVVDYVSPSQVGVGQVSVMGLVGQHLRNVTLAANPPGSVTLSNYDNSQDDRTNAFLAVSPSAPVGNVVMTLTDPSGQQFTFTIEIQPAGARRALASHRVVTGASISPVAPDIWFQDFRSRRPGLTRVVKPGLVVEEPAGARTSPSDIDVGGGVAFWETFTILSYYWQTAVVFDPVTGALGDAILHGLGVGQSVQLGAYVFSFYAAITATVYWSIDFSGDFTFPEVCFSGVIATEVPGLAGTGHYNATDCFGGNTFGDTSGTTGNITFTGGACASVTPVTFGDGIGLADVTQDACCTQPIGISASGTTFDDSFFPGNFDFTMPNAGEATPGGQCQNCNVTIQPYPGGTTPTACIFQDHQVNFTAVGNPAGGTFQWQLQQQGGQASIQGNANQGQVTISGAQTSAAADDVTLAVDYTVAGLTCSQQVNFTVIGVTLDFSDSGLMDPMNDKSTTRQWAGAPQLGQITPGNPPGATGFYENMQIKGTVTPCDPNLNLRCNFDFKRVRSGSAGTYNPATGVFTPDPNNDCPQGNCDDDLQNTDEDLVLDPPPGCGVFVLDTPGISAGSCRNEGGFAITCFDFIEWLNVDNLPGLTVDTVPPGDQLPWYASTHLRCTNGSWALDPGGQGNVIGQGAIDCSSRTGMAAPREAAAGAALNLQQARERLRSPSDEDRLAAFRAIAGRIAGLAAPERQELVTDLIAAARLRETSSPLESTPVLAMQLLGKLRAPEAIPVLFERLLDDLPRFIVSDASAATPASQALAALGAKALGPILERAGSASEAEWAGLRSSLALMQDRAAVRAAVARSLAGGKQNALGVQRLRAIDPR